jgi:hypothetical protein
MGKGKDWEAGTTPSFGHEFMQHECDGEVEERPRRRII